MSTRACSSCNKDLQRSEYSKNQWSKGAASKCKGCVTGGGSGGGGAPSVEASKEKVEVDENIQVDHTAPIVANNDMSTGDEEEENESGIKLPATYNVKKEEDAGQDTAETATESPMNSSVSSYIGDVSLGNNAEVEAASKANILPALDIEHEQHDSPSPTSKKKVDEEVAKVAATLDVKVDGALNKGVLPKETAVNASDDKNVKDSSAEKSPLLNSRGEVKEEEGAKQEPLNEVIDESPTGEQTSESSANHQSNTKKEAGIDKKDGDWKKVATFDWSKFARKLLTRACCMKSVRSNDTNVI